TAPPAHAEEAARQSTAAALGQLEWDRLATDLDAYGCAVLEKVLPSDACESLVALYTEDARFRSRVVMAQHGFGRGEYRYFAHPLPPLVADLRHALFPPLATIANRWNELMGLDVRFPADLAAFLERCHRAGQTRPTPLLLRYGAGDY